MCYLTLQDLSSAHCLSVGITSCSTSSVCSSDEIDTHASTASNRTESLNQNKREILLVNRPPEVIKG